MELRPQCALTPRGALLFFGAVCAGSLSVAGFWTWQGFWPILPFAGLELVLLGWALHRSMRRRFNCEIIVITADDIKIQCTNGGFRSETVFPRHWASVKLRTPLRSSSPSRLTVESYGRACEVGGFLTEAERRLLAVRLKQLVGNINESPTL